MRLPRGRRLLVLLALLAPVAWGLVRASAPNPDSLHDAYAAAIGLAAQQLVDADHTLCVSLDAGRGPGDPGERFLKQVHFSGPIAAGSRCRTDEAGATVAATGARAVVLTAISAQRVSKGELWVEVRHFRTQRYSGIRTYRVVHEAGGWTALGQIIKDGPV